MSTVTRILYGGFTGMAATGLGRTVGRAAVIASATSMPETINLSLCRCVYRYGKMWRGCEVTKGVQRTYLRGKGYGEDGVNFEDRRDNLPGESE